MNSVVRFAPSLTGYLHLGHVVHMIYVWAVACRKNLSVLCRIEDHDTSRNRPEYESALLADMDWLGFIPDLGIQASDAPHPSAYRQSDCTDRYASFLSILEEKGLVYGCACSRKEIQQQQEGGELELHYPGTCARKGLPLNAHTVRFRVPDAIAAFHDARLGDQCQTPADQCGDFSLRDREGHWTYQFCCVCDDITQNVGLVVRGEDILSSTGRQIQLFEALGHTPPTYFHHELLCDSEGRKLSKRQHVESITQQRENGVSAETVIGHAAFSARLISEDRPVTAQEIIEHAAALI